MNPVAQQIPVWLLAQALGTEGCGTPSAEDMAGRNHLLLWQSTSSSHLFLEETTLNGKWGHAGVQAGQESVRAPSAGGGSHQEWWHVLARSMGTSNSGSRCDVSLNSLLGNEILSSFPAGTALQSKNESEEEKENV